jgi:hypothetical protein
MRLAPVRRLGRIVRQAATRLSGGGLVAALTTRLRILPLTTPLPRRATVVADLALFLTMSGTSVVSAPMPRGGVRTSPRGL